MYIQNIKWYKYTCNKCGWSEGWIVEGALLGQGVGCSCCAGRTAVLGINTIWDTDRWMCDLGVSEEDAKSHTRGSHKKIIIKCPDCGKDKEISIFSVFYRKTIACSCGDGKSYSEKFIGSVLNQLSVNFETEYSPSYIHKLENNKISKKRSDFYIPSMNLIIETDGGLGHKGGKTHTKSKNTLEELIEIDKWKDEQHKLHGVETVRINCFESDMDYIKNSIINSKLNELFDLSKVDWLKCEEYALKNIVKEVCEYWNNKEEWETTSDLATIFNMSKDVIRKYLKKGNDINWCSYVPEIELTKGRKKNCKNGKQVSIFSERILLGTFGSCMEIERKSEELFGCRLLQSQISKACLNEEKNIKDIPLNIINLIIRRIGDMIYKLMNSESFIKISSSFICGLKEATKFIADLYDNEPENLCCEYTDEEIEDILNNNEFFLISRNYYGDGEVEYFCEPLLHDGVQYYSEADVFFVDDDLVDVIDEDKLSGEILTFRFVEEDEEECDCFEKGYEQGYQAAVSEMRKFLDLMD